MIKTLTLSDGLKNNGSVYYSLYTKSVLIQKFADT